MPLAGVMTLDSASFAISALSLGLITLSFNGSTDGQSAEQESPKERQNIFQDVREGLSYVLHHPVLRMISLMMALFNFFNTTIFTQLVLFGKERLDASDTQIGLLYTAGSLGVVVLSLLAGPLRKRWSFSRVALTALTLNGVCALAFSLMRWYWLALILWALESGLGILFNINRQSAPGYRAQPHALARHEHRGRPGLVRHPLGSLLGGYAITATHNVALVYACIAVITIIIPICFAFTPLGEAEKYLPKKEEKAPEAEMIAG